MRAVAAILMGLGLLLGPSPRPTLASVSLISFTAKGEAAAILLEWETATELDTQAFQLQRSPAREGPFQTLPGSLVAARGGPVEGGRYSWRDQSPLPGRPNHYRLVSVEANQSLHPYDRVVCAQLGGDPCPAAATATARPSASPRPSQTASPSPRATLTLWASATPRRSSTVRPTAGPRATVGADPTDRGAAPATATARPADRTPTASGVSATPAAGRATEVRPAAGGSRTTVTAGGSSGDALGRGATPDAGGLLRDGAILPTMRPGADPIGAPPAGQPPAAEAGAAGPDEAGAASSTSPAQTPPGLAPHGRLLVPGDPASAPSRSLGGVVVPLLALILVGLAWRMKRLVGP